MNIAGRLAKWLGAALLVLILLFAAFEAFALYRAQQKTPEVLAAASKGELQLSEVPPRRLAMLLRVEDPGFYRHHGVDFSTRGQGMTSITQSLVKHFYFDHFRPGFAKIEQSLIARFVLDHAMTKQAQLAAFLNFSQFGTVDGETVIGLSDAARTYYGRTPGQLTDRQFLSLVAMLMAPNALDLLRHPRANAERVARIEAMLAGKCAPRSLGDVTYDACAEFVR